MFSREGNCFYDMKTSHLIKKKDYYNPELMFPVIKVIFKIKHGWFVKGGFHIWRGFSFFFSFTLKHLSSVQHHRVSSHIWSFSAKTTIGQTSASYTRIRSSDFSNASFEKNARVLLHLNLNSRPLNSSFISTEQQIHKYAEHWENKALNNIGIHIPMSCDLHTCWRLLQYQEATCTMEAEMAVGVWTVVEMRPNSGRHKLCRDRGRDIVDLLGYFCVLWKFRTAVLFFPSDHDPWIFPLNNLDWRIPLPRPNIFP